MPFFFFFFLLSLLYLQIPLSVRMIWSQCYDAQFVPCTYLIKSVYELMIIIIWNFFLFDISLLSITPWGNNRENGNSLIFINPNDFSNRTNIANILSQFNIASSIHFWWNIELTKQKHIEHCIICGKMYNVAAPFQPLLLHSSKAVAIYNCKICKLQNIAINRFGKWCLLFICGL